MVADRRTYLKEVTDELRKEWPNHPNRKGHELIAREILRWFI